MIRTFKITGGDTARVEYYIARATSDDYAIKASDRDDARALYYSGHTANGPGRWLGRGADALGLTDQEASPETFRAAVLESYIDGARRAKPVMRTPAAGKVAAEPFAEAVRAIIAERATPEPDLAPIPISADRVPGWLDEKPARSAALFASGIAATEWDRICRKADHFDTISAGTIARSARAVGGVDLGSLYGQTEWAAAEKVAQTKVDVRLAAVDVVMTADKSVSLVYATGDDATRAIVLREFHEANRAALGYLDTVTSGVRRGSSRHGTIQEIGSDGLVAVGFVHDEARPTGDCRCGDPHLHEHVIVMNSARGQDGRWSGTQIDDAAKAAKTAGHLQEAELRARLSESLNLTWRPVVNGLADVEGITDEQIRYFSKRTDDVEAEQAEAGTLGTVGDQVANHANRQAKRDQLQIGDRVAYWQVEAASVGLDPATALDRPVSRERPVERDGADYAVAILDRLTTEASSFTRSDLLRCLADDCRQGERVGVLTARADAILASPELVVALAEGEGGLTRNDVRRGANGQVRAYGIDQKWTTPQQLVLEAALVDSAVRRVGTDCARLDKSTVEAVIARQALVAFVLSEEQATAVRTLTMSGNGVDVLHAGAGTGKTSAVLGSVRQAYEAAGFRVVGATTSAKAARVLESDGGLDARTIAQTLIDLRHDRSKIGSNTVLVLDEASMTGSRDLAALLQHAEAGGAKVVVVGDDRQLTAVDAGGGFRGLRDRLGAATLSQNRRQHVVWERDALADLAAGRPAEALRAYRAHERVTVSDSGLAARRAMVDGWWRDAIDHGLDHTIMEAVRNVDRVELNALARDVMWEAGRLADDEVTVAGHTFAVGDRVLLTKNCRQAGADNGDLGVLAGIDVRQHRAVVDLDRGRQVSLPSWYLNEGFLDHGYATTVHKIQATTVETAHVLGIGLAQEAGYVALSRGRVANHLYLTEGESREDPALDLPSQASRGAYTEAARILGTSQAKRLALDTATWGADAERLKADLGEAARLLRTRPASDVARLPALRAEVTRIEAAVVDAEARLNSSREQLGQLGRWDRQRPVLTDRVERQTVALVRLGASLADVQATVSTAEQRTTPRDLWEAEHTEPLERAVDAGRELSWRSRAEQKAAETIEPPVVEVEAPVVRMDGPVLERSA